MQRPGDTVPHQQEIEAVIDKRLEQSGGLIPTTLALGPYTISDPGTGTDPIYTEVVDLGALALGIANYEIVLTAIDFDGGAPGPLLIDFDVSIDGTHWFNDNSSEVIGQRPLMVNQPASIDPTSLPAIVAGKILLSRYTRLYVAWSGDQGPASSATFHVNLTYF